MEITPSEKFSFDPSKWIAWKQRFERFRTAMDFFSQPSSIQTQLQADVVNLNHDLQRDIDA